MGGTSLSAPAWAGLLALVNQGRAAAGESALNSTSPTETQQALYTLPQSDYNVITSPEESGARSVAIRKLQVREDKANPRSFSRHVFWPMMARKGMIP